MNRIRRVGRKCPGWKIKCGIIVKSKYGTYCPKCHNAEAKEYYKKHPKSINESLRNRRNRGRIYLNKHKEKPCADCGIQYPPYVMDFDHVRGKKAFQLSIRIHYSIERLRKEIEKCDVVCANCHRIRSHQRRISNKPVV